MRHRKKYIALSMTAALMVTACGSDSKDTSSSTTVATSTASTTAPAATTGSTATSDTSGTTAASEASTPDTTGSSTVDSTVDSTGSSTVDTTPTTSSGPAGGTFVFGASADPVVLDGAFVSDGESLRAIHEIFETLVTTKPGGTDIVPLLADSWESSTDGLAWTFHLHKGVKFQDDTDFNAKAVCFNFDRWYNFAGISQSASVSYYWGTVFGGFSDGAVPSLYKSCDAKDDNTAVINLTAPSAAFLAGLAVPAFSIASPDALTKYEADKVGGTADAPTFDGTFGTEHPVGTGAFTFDSWQPGDKLTLKRNENYWGSKALLDELIFKPIADGPARRTALETGEIQGYDLVDPADTQELQDNGYQLLLRPAFNVGYLGFNQSKPPLDNLKIRQAIAYALNRDALVKAKYPPGSEVAKEFMPPSLFGYSNNVTEYPYDPAKAKELIKESGVTDLTLEFYYPSEVSRPYMPDPTANFEAFSADLEAVGFKVVPKTAPWRGGYLDDVNSGNAQIYFLGWTGDYGDPDNFVGTFFRTKQDVWGFDNQEIFDALTKARDTQDLAERTKLYEHANELIMDFLPGVPYVHTQPALAFAPGVTGYVPSPVSIESFAGVSLG